MLIDTDLRLRQVFNNLTLADIVSMPYKQGRTYLKRLGEMTKADGEKAQGKVDDNGIAKKRLTPGSTVIDARDMSFSEIHSLIHRGE